MATLCPSPSSAVSGFTGDADKLDSHPELSALWQLWNRVRGNRAMPSRRDFTPELLRPWLGNLALIDVGAEPASLHYRLVGTMIVANLRFDPTGKAFDEFFTDPVNNPQTRGLYRCLQQQCEVFEVVSPKHNRYFSNNYYRLILPLSADGKSINMIMMGEYIVTQSLLETSSDNVHLGSTKIWF